MGTYVIPPGVHIYFFARDGEGLQGETSIKIENRLTKPLLEVLAVNKYAIKLHCPWV